MGDFEEEPKIRLKDGFKISDLMKDGTTFEVNFEHEEEPEQLAYKPEDVYMYGNPACLNIIDEDTYQDDQPFANIAKLMVDLTPDGKVKKRVIREGYGEVMPHMATVTVDYNAYLEYNDEPFDSTYIRKQPHKFHVSAGETIVGLDVAVASMKINEKSQFLFDPEYAFGTLGCLDRVPPNSVCLFEIEVKNVVDSGASYTFEKLPESEQNNFEEIYKYANALCMRAKDLCKRGGWKAAIKDYNVAVSKLENCTLRDMEDQEKQQRLLLRLFTNLAVVNTKLQEPRRGCFNCNKAFNLCKGTSLKPSAKLYFNNARCLILLGDHDRAEYQLKKAQALEPLNIEISNLLKKLETDKKKNLEQEVAVAKAYFNPKVAAQITETFKESIKHYCQELLDNSALKKYTLPKVLSGAELKFVTDEVKKFGLDIEHFKAEGGVTKYCIVKCKSDSLTKKVQQLKIN